MPEYKLIYGNARGLAEPIRQLFALAKVPYEDYRIPVTPGSPPAIPPEIKEKLPFGQIPILEVEGHIISQSSAIARFLARRFNLFGADEFEAARIDEINDALADYSNAWKAVYFAKDEEAKAAAFKNAVEVASPKYLGIFTEILKKNGDFYVGKSVTLADITMANALGSIKTSWEVDVLENYPVLQAHVNRINEIPEIKEWIVNRPVTKF